MFDTLVDSRIKTVVCRHEQNAAFIAGGIGRMTGKAGVVLVTSGPGCSNLVTGLATANSEGDPVVAIGGAVPIANRLKQVHQSISNSRRRKLDSTCFVHFNIDCTACPLRDLRGTRCGLFRRPIAVV